MFPKELEDILNECNDEIDRYWFMLEDGAPVSEWYSGIGSALATFFLIALMLGLGKVMPNIETKYLDAKKRISARLQTQLEYLKNFSNEIKDAQENGEDLKGKWRKRAQMYSGSVQQAYWEGKLYPMPLNLPVPGDGSTECLSNCKCWWRQEMIDAKNNDYDLYWEKSIAENCDTCKRRNKNWYPLQVRGGALITPILIKELTSHKHLRGEHDQRTHGNRGVKPETVNEYRQNEEIYYSSAKRDGVDTSPQDIAEQIGLKLNDGSLDKTLKDIYNFYDEETKLRTVIKMVKTSIGNRPGIVIDGEIMDKNNYLAGSFERTIGITEDNKIFVEHTLLWIDDYYQGAGVGTSFYRQTEKEYKKAGVHHIRLEANLDIGGYAWARMGFSPGARTQATFVKEAAKKWQSEAQEHTSNAEFPGISNFFELATLSAPWDIGDHFGKRFLLDGRINDSGHKTSRFWEGSKILDENDLGYQVGEAYYKAKDAKKRK